VPLCELVAPLRELVPPLRVLASPLAPPLCWGCRGPAPASSPLCQDCRARLRWLGPAPVTSAGVECWAPLAYEGPARELARALKFRAAQALSDTMAAQIAATAPPGFAGGALVPVPLGRGRLRSRGYNQAERLARALSRRAGLPLADCLERRGQGPPQVGRPRSERLRGPPGIRLARGAAAPASVLLVDDVITTGATLAACAAVLRAAGAAEIRAIAYARTLAR
jgi:ComF family protein